MQIIDGFLYADLLYKKTYTMVKAIVNPLIIMPKDNFISVNLVSNDVITSITGNIIKYK